MNAVEILWLIFHPSGNASLGQKKAEETTENTAGNRGRRADGKAAQKNNQSAQDTKATQEMESEEIEGMIKKRKLENKTVSIPNNKQSKSTLKKTQTGTDKVSF